MLLAARCAWLILPRLMQIEKRQIYNAISFATKLITLNTIFYYFFSSSSLVLFLRFLLKITYPK